MLAVRINHTVADGPGIVQFMTALAEIAQGATEPSIKPVWRRDILNARDPPRITCTHHEFDQEILPRGTNTATHVVAPSTDLVQQSFFFGQSEITAIRRMLPRQLAGSTAFEVVTAFL